MHAFFLATKSLSCSQLIFPVSLAYYLSVCPVGSVLALNLGAVLIGSDSILREVGTGGAKKNRAIKRFRNRASSNHDFISISINRTALVHMYSTVKNVYRLIIVKATKLLAKMGMFILLYAFYPFRRKKDAERNSI